MTDINMVRELTNAELELVAGGAGGETNNSYNCSETVSTPRGNIIEVGNGSIGETLGEHYSNKAQ
jgi:hypothetical protein